MGGNQPGQLSTRADDADGRACPAIQVSFCGRDAENNYGRTHSGFSSAVTVRARAAAKQTRFSACAAGSFSSYPPCFALPVASSASETTDRSVKARSGGSVDARMRDSATVACVRVRILDYLTRSNRGTFARFRNCELLQVH